MNKKSIFEVAKLRRKGEITIPQEIRDAAEIKDGDIFKVKIIDGKIVLDKITD